MFKKQRNVDTIIRDLSNMVEELEVCKADQITEANRQTAIINDAELKRDVALAESDRAAGIAEKIANLIS